MATILLIEDEKAIRNVLRSILIDENKSWKVLEAENGKAGIDILSTTPIDLVFCDIKMPGMDGIEVLDKIGEMEIETQVVMISGHGDLDTAVDCIKKGAFDYISKPPDLNRLLQTVRLALDKGTLVAENKKLKKKISSQYQMIGSSNALEQIRGVIEKVAPTDARVFITGPNGSGKEVIAHQIHERSERANAPLIEVNCAAIPSELIESELFGHKKGAFTSAVRDRKGKFELAHGGTLFLDEIGDMSANAQAKVLRALQENQVTPVGGDKSININTRVIAATNKDVAKEIAEGRFREDLYHRLSVILINVPSLSDRKEDIPELTLFFSKKIAKEHGVAEKTFEPQAIVELSKHSWSGNIREFRNVMERLYILCGSVIKIKDITQNVR